PGIPRRAVHPRLDSLLFCHLVSSSYGQVLKPAPTTRLICMSRHKQKPLSSSVRSGVGFAYSLDRLIVANAKIPARPHGSAGDGCDDAGCSVGTLRLTSSCRNLTENGVDSRPFHRACQRVFTADFGDLIKWEAAPVEREIRKAWLCAETFTPA